MLYACDYKWWQHHLPQVRRVFRGKLWTQYERDGDDNKHLAGSGVHLVRSVAAPGLSTDPGVIHQGQSSGYQAINLALHFGASRIVLIGYDLGHNGKTHFFGDHPTGLQVNSPFASWQKQYRTIDPAAYDIEIINCTRGGNLDAFERAELGEALRR